MSEPFVTNDGKTLHVLEVGDGSWGWAVWDPSDIRSCNSGVTDSRKAACAAAERAAGIDPAEPPAPPAWMVEVAREVSAKAYERLGATAAAYECRSGSRDGSAEIADLVAALSLALERGHVVERTTVERDDVKCRCVGRQGPNPECGACGGSGCVTADVPRDWAEEALLKAAREDAAQIYHDRGMPMMATEVRAGMRDDDWAVLTALQARRNMLREGAVAATQAAMSSAGLESLARRSWRAGFRNGSCQSQDGGARRGR